MPTEDIEKNQRMGRGVVDSVALLDRRAWAIRWSSRVQSFRLAERALQVASKGSLTDQASALRTLGWQARWRGDFEQAESFAEQALRRLEPDLAPVLQADALSILAVVHYSRGRRDVARRAVEFGFEKLGAHEAAETRVDLLLSATNIERGSKRFDEAALLLDRALEIASGPELARVEHDQARACYADGDAECALEWGQRAVNSARVFRNRVILPYALEAVGGAYRMLGREPEAAAHLEEGGRIAAEDGDGRVACQCMAERAQLALDEGDCAGALEPARQGLEQARSMGYVVWQKKFLTIISAAAEGGGALDEALAASKALHVVKDCERD
ncbi:MAG: hypothetical protein AAF968_02795 [Pseudomonadota bacterium]